jgi:glycosyltransferase involved in cell wall biosynthesis
VFTVVHDLAAALHRAGRPVAVLCDGAPLTDALGPDAICFIEIPADQPFDWRAAFAGKLVYGSLTAFLADDRRRAASLLGRVGVIHSHLDQLIFRSGHPENSKHYDRTLSDSIAARTGFRPRLVRTRHDDMSSSLDGIMRLSGIDYPALDRPGRERLLGGGVDLWSAVAEHVRRHRDLLSACGVGQELLENAAHHVWWLVHQLLRWRYEVAHFDAVVCLSAQDADRTRDWLLCDGVQNLTFVPNGSSFAPRSRARTDGLLHDYHYRAGLSCYRGAGANPEPVAFAREDKKVVFVGRPVRMKGIYELVESLRNLYHSGRQHVRGILVGEFWPELRQELAALDPAHAGDYLLFTGRVEDLDVLAALLAFGDVTAVPSYYEPFCLVALESYRMGTPCVVTEGTGAGEAYLANPRRHGLEIALPVRRRHRDGIMRFYGVDVDSLTAQLAFLIDHPPVARRMAEDGERFVRQHYSAERMAARYSDLYDLLLAGEPACRLHG